MMIGERLSLRLLLRLLLVFGALWLAAPQVAAQTDEERAGARAAATEGARAFRERRYAEAIDLFTRAESLVHAPPHLLFIGRAQSELGLLVQARENLLKVMRDQLPANAPKAFHDAQDQARDELQKLEGRLPYVTINVDGGGTARFAVTEDGRRIPDALIGVPRPVNPGRHQYEAVAEGLRGTSAVDIKEGQRESVVLRLEPAAGVSAPPAGPAATETAPGEPTSPAGSDPTLAVDSGGTNSLRILSYVALGVGVVGLAVGTVFALQAGSKSDEASQTFDDNNCNVTGCPAQKAEIAALDEDAASARTLATVGFIAGGVGIAAGIGLFIASSSSSGGDAQTARPPRPRVTPWVGLGHAGLRGTF